MFGSENFTGAPAISQATIMNSLPKEKVTGIGGVFFQARDPAKMAAWYQAHLGVQSEDGCADFSWREKDNPEQIGRTVWAIFPKDAANFGRSNSPWMINYRVSNLDRMIEQLRQAVGSRDLL